MGATFSQRKRKCKLHGRMFVARMRYCETEPTARARAGRGGAGRQLVSFSAPQYQDSGVCLCAQNPGIVWVTRLRARLRGPYSTADLKAKIQ